MVGPKMTWTAPGRSWKWAICALAVFGLAVPVQAEPAQAAKLEAVALAKAIDARIQKHLVTNKVQPSALADDAEFLRRVYLDITGVIPPADKAAAFLNSTETNKRAKLIDELLAS